MAAKYQTRIPHVGDTVHFVDLNRECKAAIVTLVVDPDRLIICLTVFNTFSQEPISRCQDVEFDYGHKQTPKTWHWI